MPKVIEFYTVAEAAKLLGCAVKPAVKMAVKKQFPCAIWYGREWLIPMRDLRAVMTLDMNPELAGLTWTKRKDIMRKWSKMRQYDGLLRRMEYRVRSWGGKQLHREAAKTIGIPLRTLQRWEHCFRLNGIRGLLDKRGGDLRRSKR